MQNTNLPLLPELYNICLGNRYAYIVRCKKRIFNAVWFGGISSVHEKVMLNSKFAVYLQFHMVNLRVVLGSNFIFVVCRLLCGAVFVLFQ